MKQLFMLGISALMIGPAAGFSGVYEGYLEGQRQEAQLEETRARTALIRQCGEVLRNTGRMPEACATVMQSPPLTIKERRPAPPPSYRCERDSSGASCFPINGYYP